MLAVTAVCVGCDRGGGERPEPIVLRDLRAVSFAVTTSVGSADNASQLGMVASARLVGTHLVALDIMPPFVKVYDSAGVFVRAFGEKGGGPGEIDNPVAIAAVGDSAIITADFDGRLITWALDGSVLAQSRPDGFRPMTMVSCGGFLLLYGPGQITAGRTTWLRKMEGGEVFDAAMLVDSVVVGQPLGYGGRPYGLITLDDGFALRHEFGPTPKLLTGSCANSGNLRPVMELRPIEPRPLPRGGAVQAGSPDLPVAVGLARIGETFLLGDYYRSGASRYADTTVIVAVSDRTRDTILVPGRVVLQDSHPAYGVLFSTTDPEPALFLVRARELDPSRLRPK